MTKRLVLVSVIAFFLLFSVSCAENTMESAIAAEYGAWSAWTDEVLQPEKDVEIERRVSMRVTDNFSWHYTRYVYFDETEQKWYSTGESVEEAYDGRWEEKTSDEPLKEISGGLYEGGWYNENVSSSQQTGQVYEYRSRVVKRVTCEVSTDEILVLPKKTYQLAVNFFDGGTNTYVSNDITVATVDQTGLVLGVSPGAAQITVSSSKGRYVVIDVYVCQAGVSLPEGVYTFRLIGSNKAMTVGKRINSRSDNVMVSAYTGGKNQRFVVSTLSDQTFNIHPLSDKNRYLDIARGGKPLSQGANVQIHINRDRTSQNLRALYVPDGSYIIYPKADSSLTIGAEPEEAGTNVRLENMGALETVDRWIPIRTTNTTATVNKFIRPVARNGISYVFSEFNSQTRFKNGMLFGSNGRRVYVLSCADGKVLAVNDSCQHDYPKSPNASGEIIDPCDASSESIGNYIIIEHDDGIICLYANLSKVFVSAGDEIKQGALIGKSGATGSADQIALYLEMRQTNIPVNPRDYINLPEINIPIGE